ncbi:NAD-dependent epimerase/dehydratase family protein [Francisella tularensis]|uniref:NAD-dependent epimerase/dehydratase family protein n=1 Tax=Francisella tularensis TaxID=263 RepID=UPI0002EFB83B|nr:NAD(P)-dependent oxidoreductase [Francisella tularensis]MBK2335680.1 NAD(P)-dependent oxidoreductase [Francisella tularensis subsp. novicida]
MGIDKVAITGVTGMVGSHVKLLFDRLSIPTVAVTRAVWDLSEWKSDQELDKIFKDVSTIFHIGAVLSADNIKKLFDVNVRSVLNICQWALNKNIKVIYISGATVYEDTTKCNINEAATKVVCGLGGIYGYSKLLAENVLSHYESQGLRVCILRPSSIYGYGLASDKVLNVFIRNAIDGKKIFLSNPNNRVNLIHAMDVAYACFQVYDRSVEGVFNIAAEKLYSFYDIAKMVISVVGKGGLDVCNDSAKLENRFDLDCSKAKKEFGFFPRIGLKSGIESIYNKTMLLNMFCD